MAEYSKKPKVIAVVGPTASGKTSLGVYLAKRFNGEVVSCDSMQVYNNMPIASAAPTKEETQSVPHHLVGFCDPSANFSVAKYVELAQLEIDDILSRGKLPILVGGTGLYIDSLLSGTRFSEEDSSEIRQKLEQEAEQIGYQAMLEKLREIDPETAAKYHPNDRKRIIRALEIFELHGKTKTEMDKESRLSGGLYDVLWIGITYKNRELLYDRINRRVDIMLENGVLNEARTAFLNSRGITSVQAIGHKEFFPFFEGRVSLEEAVESLKMETRRYAKRQLTWFRRNKNIHWIYADETPNVGEIAESIIKEN
ncbi:MAG: tRNA (adenosine(37)-N6)-dimethylallyltransferase MiaA [Clostridia bacterium]|nr:tRNA (adenosine(37)-N6)-dimethylallyltransferase MiaA [Clostridia bacterium]